MSLTWPSFSVQQTSASLACPRRMFTCSMIGGYIRDFSGPVNTVRRETSCEKDRFDDFYNCKRIIA